MVARKFVVRHEDSSFDVDYDTEDGLEVPLSLSLSLSISKHNLFSSSPIRIDDVMFLCRFYGFKSSPSLWYLLKNKR